MSNPLETTTSIAKAVEKTASLLEGIGKFVAPYLEDFIGLHGGDRLHYRRLENMARIAKKSEERIKDIGQERISEPSPSMLLPLLSSSADEERPELIELWASLLANAAIDHGTKVRREFFDTLKNMEPIDAIILEAFSLMAITNPPNLQQQIFTIAHEVALKGISAGLNNINIEVALEALRKLGCITLGAPWSLTSYGTAFKAACKVQ